MLILRQHSSDADSKVMESRQNREGNDEHSHRPFFACLSCVPRVSDRTRASRQRPVSTEASSAAGGAAYRVQAAAVEHLCNG